MSSPIGGIDLILRATQEGFEPRLLLDPVFDLWPEAMFQDVEESGTLPLMKVLAEDSLLTTKEFFVYRDDQSARTWDQQGWTSGGTNNMVHFLIRDDPSRQEDLQITMVIDDLNDEMAGLYSSLTTSLQQVSARVRRLRTRPRRLNIEAELRAAGCDLTRSGFYDLVDEIRQTLYPDWSQDELACHPHDAQQFCTIVRSRVSAPIPDNVIMKAMLNRHKSVRR
jgi:hypothetical protein